MGRRNKAPDAAKQVRGWESATIFDKPPNGGDGNQGGITVAKSYCNLLYHLVFSTHSRRNYLYSELQPRIHEYLAGAIRGEGGIALAINGVDDHVHILAKLRQ